MLSIIVIRPSRISMAMTPDVVGSVMQAIVHGDPVTIIELKEPKHIITQKRSSPRSPSWHGDLKPVERPGSEGKSVSERDHTRVGVHNDVGYLCPGGRKQIGRAHV